MDFEEILKMAKQAIDREEELISQETEYIEERVRLLVKTFMGTISTAKARHESYCVKSECNFHKAYAEILFTHLVLSVREEIKKEYSIDLFIM